MVAASQHAHSAQHALLAEDEEDDRSFVTKFRSARIHLFLGRRRCTRKEGLLLPRTEEEINFNTASNGYFDSSWSVHCPFVRCSFFAYSNIPTRANYLCTIKEASHHHVRAHRIRICYLLGYTGGRLFIHGRGRKICNPRPILIFFIV